MEKDPREGSEEWGLVTPFLTDDPMFAAGCEFGMLFCRIREHQQSGSREEITDYIQRENQDRVCVMAGRLGYRVAEMKPWDKHWLFIRLVRPTA